MAKCPVCGKIWECSDDLDITNHYIDGSDEYIMLKDPRYQHCSTCRCDACRKGGKPYPTH